MTDEAIHDLLLRVEAKDRSTAAHTWRVVLYARAVAEAGGAPHTRSAVARSGNAGGCCRVLSGVRCVQRLTTRLDPKEHLVHRFVAAVGMQSAITAPKSPTARASKTGVFW